jgi:peptidyl-prolyl cis-trans isomerase A (cyclophilin A)
MNRTLALVLFSLFLSLSPRVYGQAQPAASQPPSQSSQQPEVKKSAPASTQSKTTGGTHATLLHPSALTAKAPAEYDVKFVTSKGDFVIHVTRAWAPLGADRFYNLVTHHFYDGCAFFRVVPKFVVQFGLTGDPAINKSWEEAKIKDDPKTQSNKPGTITFATAGANTRTTQVFINFGNNSFLDNQGFAPFGEVTSGMDVVQNLYSGYADQPTNHQEEITTQGKAYLDKAFPNLDHIKTATFVSPAADSSSPARKPAAKSESPAAKPKS